MATRPTIDPVASLIHLGRSGQAHALRCTAGIWRELKLKDGDRIVGVIRGRVPADFHADHWEIHPAGDELLMLLSGEVDLILEQRPRDRRIRLRAGKAFIVPRGRWHRFVIRRPCKLLFCTPACGTRHKPVAA
jgi:mannose-6-phosphate isomerase-like protein (cupin superfamily)